MMEAKSLSSSSSSSSGTNTESFIASTRFAGRKSGYFFNNGVRGLGYYRDPVQVRKLEKEAESKQKEGEEPSRSK
jgi:hypothetical protein